MKQVYTYLRNLKKGRWAATSIAKPDQGTTIVTALRKTRGVHNVAGRSIMVTFTD